MDNRSKQALFRPFDLQRWLGCSTARSVAGSPREADASSGPKLYPTSSRSRGSALLCTLKSMV
eukprot:15465984-Alexandrium_andersonii.AAC.1